MLSGGTVNMTFSTSPNDQFCLLIIRVDDLDVLHQAINIARSATIQFGNTYCRRSIERIDEEVTSTIDLYRRNSNEN